MEPKIIEKQGFCIVENKSGPTLGFTQESGVKIIEKDGLFFKDLSRSGELLPYEDWRLDADTRAKDLASRLTIEQIAGLMLYSKHQNVPMESAIGYFSGTYNGKSIQESGVPHWSLTDQLKEILQVDGIRFVLARKYENAEIAARWNNAMQSFVEKQPFGIPVNTSSDPRHGAAFGGKAEYKTIGDTSTWPGGLGIAATFDPSIVFEFGKVVQAEYRALGITTALSPQADLSTEPRWMRHGDTFGAHPQMAADMTREYCEALQETDGKGWGEKSVITMAKHWPGGGPCEAGRDAHYIFGKYAVYPGGCLEEHLKPFLDGAFKLGNTQKCGAIMPYYTISYGVDPNENVGNSYSHYIINDLLREKYGYDGVVCSDWGITADEGPNVDSFQSRCFGTEHLSVAERHLKILMSGVDQFGGNNDSKPVIEAYKIGCERYGKEVMEKRFRESAARLLRGSFRVGLFENPYIDVDEAVKTVGNEEFVKKGIAAQLKSIVLLKNNGALPLKSEKKLKVFVPKRHIGETAGFMRERIPPHDNDPAPAELNEYFERVSTPDEADFALVFIESPITNPYMIEDLEKGENGYRPTSLQYRPYTATTARYPSIAGGDPLEKFTNRSHRGKTTVTANECDLDNILNARKAMGTKPVIVAASMPKPIIPHEFEKDVDAYIVHFGVEAPQLFDILVGKAEPSGLLPVQIPKNMETVEAHCEDKPFDMEPYVDSVGNVYDFGYGLNWSGIISDERTKRYHKY